ncbi:MAG: substrate-binding domain-containing protein [Opitutae bacterium]|nr:substrate-binding domain-containing protein [Opitutae bacterium]
MKSLARLLLLTVSLAAAVAAFASRAKPVIGLSLDKLKEERWQRDRDLFVAEAAKLGAEVIVQSANSDDTRQLRDIESLISRGVDVLVVAPHNGAAMSRAVKSAHEAGIPVMAYDRLILNCDIALYVTFDSVKVGELQAAWVVGRWGKNERPLRVVRIFGAPTDNNAKQFKQGQDNILAPLLQSGRVQIVAEDWALEWKPENAKKIMNAAIAKHGHGFDAVLAANDGTAGGAIQALLEEGLAGKILVTGQDADLAGCQRIMRGTQSMTVYKPVSRLALLAARAAVELARGTTPATTATLDNGFKKVPCLYEEIVSVDKDNMLSTVVASGFHSADQLK